ncbi:hypothetical protein J6590_009183 [Homalodisca vitripennis]|nr:hypothetical protein J6590_009183 [Homalodisca vitripennis]
MHNLTQAASLNLTCTDSGSEVKGHVTGNHLYFSVDSRHFSEIIEIETIANKTLLYSHSEFQKVLERMDAWTEPIRRGRLVPFYGRALSSENTGDNRSASADRPPTIYQRPIVNDHGREKMAAKRRERDCFIPQVEVGQEFGWARTRVMRWERGQTRTWPTLIMCTVFLNKTVGNPLGSTLRNYMSPRSRIRTRLPTRLPGTGGLDYRRPNPPTLKRVVWGESRTSEEADSRMRTDNKRGTTRCQVKGRLHDYNTRVWDQVVQYHKAIDTGPSPTPAARTRLSVLISLSNAVQ